MISIQQMHYILVLSEQLNFQRASEQCFVTQPTLSMQIKKAEETLGFTIFDRSRNPLELTSFGKDLVPLIREILSENDKIKILQQRMKGTFKEQIRLGIIPTVAAYMVSDMFKIWQSKIKGIQLHILEMKTEEIIDAMNRKDLDAAIIAGPFSDSGYRTITLFSEEIKVYAPGINSNKISQSDLQNLQPWLLSKGNCLRNQMIQFCQLKEKNEIEKWNYQGGNLELLMKMVDINGGYSLIPRNYSLPNEKKTSLKTVVTKNNLVPAREIIALVPNRSIKWSFVEPLFREIQMYYSENNPTTFELLDWKG
jgi:LysR family hydrogen peroxide-inducible transcriptional activator